MMGGMTTADHPRWSGAFMLRAHPDGSVTCDHCGHPYPCGEALALHRCEENMFCRDGECDFRREWAPNLQRGLPAAPPPPA